MLFTILSINWTGQALTGEQFLVLRNVAAQMLSEGRKDPIANFKHDLCEGRITRGKVGVFGTFGGTFFKADLGLVKGERWTVDFLLPRGSEHLAVNDDSLVVMNRPLKGGGFEETEIDHQAAALNPGGNIGSSAVH